MVDLIHLAKNTTLSRKVSCASNGSNNCTQNEDFSANGANLLLTYFEPPTTKQEKQIVGTKQVPIEANLKDLSDPVVTKVLKETTGLVEASLSLKFLQGPIRRYGNHQSYLDNYNQCESNLLSLTHYILGYMDYDHSQPIAQGTYYGFRVNALGSRETRGDIKRNKYTKVNHYPFIANDKTSKVITASQHANPVGIIPKHNAGDDLCSASFVTFQNYCRQGAQSISSAELYKVIKDDVYCPTITENVYDWVDIPVPGKLVFNPVQDEKGKFVKNASGDYTPSDDNEGIMHRLNALRKSNIKVDSKEQTLIFHPNNVTARVYTANNNEIEYLTNGAVIEISDTKRGIGKKSKKICLNVLGTTKVIQGDQTCEF